eukprot:scaffold109975_cov36-Prasinocladus_malaysianus.AAC.1
MPIHESIRTYYVRPSQHTSYSNVHGAEPSIHMHIIAKEWPRPGTAPTISCRIPPLQNYYKAIFAVRGASHKAQ